MKNRTFILIVCTVILCFFILSPVIAVLSMTGYMDRFNTKNLIVAEKEYPDDNITSNILNYIEKTKADLKNVYVNCVPFYSLMVSSVQSFEVSMVKLTDTMINPYLNTPEVKKELSALNDFSDTSDTSDTSTKEEPEIEYYSVLMGGNGRPSMYAIEPLKVMERVEGASDKELQKLTETELAHIHRLKEAVPDVNYYVYMGTRIQETDMYDDMITGPESTVKYFEYFKDNLDSKIKFDYFRLDTPDDRITKKYRSDHHWNIFGAYEGYKQIIGMMYEDSPEIGESVEYDIIKVPGIKWIGSIGATVGLKDEEYADDFYILDLSELPRYGGNGYNIRVMQRNFMDGDYDGSGLYYDYHGAYYPPQTKYVFKENNTGRNLLLIGDSYSWSISTIIAAHFDTTICHITPWMVPANVTYNYREFIEENNITDVLILLYSSRLLFGYDGTDFDRFLTD